MPTFPSNPSITSRLSTGSALTFQQMDANFGNLTASNDAIISVIQTASYVDSNNVFYPNTSQSFFSASISSSTIGKAVVSSLTASVVAVLGTAVFNSGLVVGGGLTGTASNAVSSSYTVTSSYAITAATASYVNSLVQNVVITGSFLVTGSTVNFKNLPTTEPLVTGSLWLSGSGVGSASGSKYLMVFTG